MTSEHPEQDHPIVRDIIENMEIFEDRCTRLIPEAARRISTDALNPDVNLVEALAKAMTSVAMSVAIDSIRIGLILSSLTHTCYLCNTGEHEHEAQYVDAATAIMDELNTWRAAREIEQGLMDSGFNPESTVAEEN